VITVAASWSGACLIQEREEDDVNTQIQTNNDKGRVAVPILLWMAGVPFTLVFLLWLFFFRGH
jgi:hypothetical protein